MESVLLTTADGHALDADLLVPDEASRGGAVVCHPHPQYGGDRFNAVVDAAWHALAHAGWTSLRFDFRAEFDRGVGERLDVIAALDELDRRVDGPIVVVGYSFGAAVGLAAGDDRVVANVAIAPPLAVMPVDPPEPPTLVVVPRHDQFTPPDAAAEAIGAWPTVDMVVIESTDHFLVGRAESVADVVTDWLAENVTVGPADETPID